MRRCAEAAAPASLHRAAVPARAAMLLMLGACTTAWAQGAAPQPSPQVAQAVAYEHGEGVPRDPQKAAALYCEAARGGDAEALFNLGWMYANGRGIGRDYDIAATLFARAADMGHAQAQRVLALFRQGHAKLPECLEDERPGASAAPFDLVRAEVDPFADLPAHKQKIADAVAELAPSYGINPRLALAVITVESNFDPRARSVKDARGLMQLIPETAARFRVKDAFDVRDNIRGGLAYLRFLLSYYRGRVALAAAAYNAGEKAVDRYGGVPPYAETRDYVRRVLALFHRDEHPFDPAAAQPSPIVDDVRRARFAP
jgi:TPR repeat protein